MAKSQRKYNFNSLGEFLDDILLSQIFQPDSEHDNTPAIEAKLDTGECPLVVITGDNATGKSVMRRIIAMAHRVMEHECMHVSQEGRSASHFTRAFIYGAENYDSTGYISAGTVLKATKTSQGRDKLHSLVFDEPDIGLSDNYAAGVGVWLREFMQDIPEHLFAVFVITHRKSLVEQLMPIKPWHLRLGKYMTLRDWLVEPIVPGNLEELKEQGHARFQRIMKFIK